MKLVFDRDEVLKIITDYAATYFEDGQEVEVRNYYDLPFSLEITPKEVEDENNTQETV